jgi:hypothetical protein
MRSAVSLGSHEGEIDREMQVLLVTHFTHKGHDTRPAVDDVEASV